MEWKNYKKSRPKTCSKNGVRKIKPYPKSSGFSLLEVMIAITLFSVFVSAFVVSQGQNVADSRTMEEELTLQNLCERKISELVLVPPRFSESLTMTKETKTFEESEYSQYEYTIEYKRLELPGLDILQGKSPTGGNNSGDEELSDKRQKDMAQTVYKQIQDNIKRIIWQVMVTVKNKENQTQYSLSTWLKNTDEPVQIQVQ